MQRSTAREGRSWRAPWLALAILALTACGPAERPYDDDDPQPDGGTVEPDAGPGPRPPVHAATAVRLVVEPGAGMTPVTQAIKDARRSVRLGVYFLSDSAVIRALKDAKGRGVSVKVLLEDAPMGLSNDDAYNTLNSAGVAVRFSRNRFNYLHEKVLVIDDATLWAMTMNLAPSAPTTNREYLLADTDAEDVAAAAAVFDADWDDRDAPATDTLVVAPANARAKLTELFQSAEREILVEWEDFSDWGLRDVLIVMARKGVSVKVVVPADIVGSTTESNMGLLKNAGAQIRKLASPDLHAKAILVDGTTGWVGSVNGTRNSLERNRELGVVWRNEQAAATLSSTFAKDFAAAKPL